MKLLAPFFCGNPKKIIAIHRINGFCTDKV